MVNSETAQIVARFASSADEEGDLGRLITLMSRQQEVDLLRTLLLSPDDLVVANGAYILSEIGEAGMPLLPIAQSLLTHPRQDVRYWAMNSVMCCADHAAAVKAITNAGLLSDPWELTRSRASRFLERAPRPRRVSREPGQ